jgi:hypothetical protein
MSTLSIRLPNSIHLHAKRLARAEGISVNQLVSSALAEKLAAIDAERYLRERAERGQSVDIDAILAKVPHVKPEPGDELSEASKWEDKHGDKVAPTNPTAVVPKTASAKARNRRSSGSRR